MPQLSFRFRISSAVPICTWYISHRTMCVQPPDNHKSKRASCGCFALSLADALSAKSISSACSCSRVSAISASWVCWFNSAMRSWKRCSGTTLNTSSQVSTGE